MIETLESLSGYRHAFELNDLNAANNPVNYSHLILTVGGRKYHVLSRICDAGIDYTQRTNKLAHHVVLTDAELTKGGPACVLSQPGFCVTKWEGEPRVIQQGRTLDPRDRAPQVCRAWQAATGDAGWGAVLAESFLEQPPRTVSVIFKPGQDLLPLVVESLALIPEERRWEVTFSTYFTRLPAGIDCHWRFLLEGSPEAKAVRANPHLKVVDLTARLGHATGGKLADVARNGAPAAAIKPATSPPSKGSASPPPPNRPSQSLSQDLDRESEARGAPADPGSISLRSEPPPIRGRFAASEAPTPSPVARRRARKRRITTPAVTAIAVLAAIGIGVLAAFAYPTAEPYLSRIFKKDVKKTRIAQADPVSRTNQLQPNAQTPESKDETNTTRKTASTPPPEPKPDPKKKNVEAPTNKNAAKSPAPKSETKATTDVTSAATPTKVTPDPFKNLRNGKNNLDLPQPNQTLGGAGETKLLAQIDPGVQRLQLHLSGTSRVFDDDDSIDIKDLGSGSGQTKQQWAVHYIQRLSRRDQVVGKFSLTSGGFGFAWESALPPHITRLRYCQLQLSSVDQSVLAPLFDPGKSRGILPSQLPRELKTPFPLDPLDLPPLKHLRLCVDFRTPTPANGAVKIASLASPIKYAFERRVDEKVGDDDLDQGFHKVNVQVVITFTSFEESHQVGLIVRKEIQWPSMDLQRSGYPIDWKWISFASTKTLERDPIGMRIDRLKSGIAKDKKSYDYQGAKTLINKHPDDPRIDTARHVVQVIDDREAKYLKARDKWSSFDSWKVRALDLINELQNKASIGLQVQLQLEDTHGGDLVLLRSENRDARQSHQ